MSNFLPAPQPGKTTGIINLPYTTNVATTPKSNTNVAFEIADFFFAIREFKKMQKEGASGAKWAGWTANAALFFIPPAKLAGLSTKVLMKVAEKASTVAASEAASVAARKVADKTASQAKKLIEHRQTGTVLVGDYKEFEDKYTQTLMEKIKESASIVESAASKEAKELAEKTYRKNIVLLQKHLGVYKSASSKMSKEDAIYWNKFMRETNFEIKPFTTVPVETEASKTLKEIKAARAAGDEARVVELQNQLDDLVMPKKSERFRIGEEDAPEVVDVKKPEHNFSDSLVGPEVSEQSFLDLYDEKQAYLDDVENELERLQKLLGRRTKLSPEDLDTEISIKQYLVDDLLAKKEAGEVIDEKKLVDLTDELDSLYTQQKTGKTRAEDFASPDYFESLVEEKKKLNAFLNANEERYNELTERVAKGKPITVDADILSADELSDASRIQRKILTSTEKEAAANRNRGPSELDIMDVEARKQTGLTESVPDALDTEFGVRSAKPSSTAIRAADWIAIKSDDEMAATYFANEAEDIVKERILTGNTPAQNLFNLFTPTMKSRFDADGYGNWRERIDSIWAVEKKAKRWVNSSNENLAARGEELLMQIDKIKAVHYDPDLIKKVLGTIKSDADISNFISIVEKAAKKNPFIVGNSSFGIIKDVLPALKEKTTSQPLLKMLDDLEKEVLKPANRKAIARSEKEAAGKNGPAILARRYRSGKVKELGPIREESTKVRDKIEFNKDEISLLQDDVDKVTKQLEELRTRWTELPAGDSKRESLKIMGQKLSKDIEMLRERIDTREFDIEILQKYGLNPPRDVVSMLLKRRLKKAGAKPTTLAKPVTSSVEGTVVRAKTNTPGAIYIGRKAGEAGIFGNPYVVSNSMSVKEAVANYRKDLLEIVTGKKVSESNKVVEILKSAGISREEFIKRLKELKGKTLACPGSEPDAECHGQILLKAIKYLTKED